MKATPLSDQLRLAKLESDLRRWEAFRFFDPYPTQRALIDASATHYELMLSAGNGGGKTMIGAFIMACHLTGEYPEWWRGRRWEKPIDAWACGKTGDQLKATVQLKLFGRLGAEEYGSGMIPRRCLLGDPVRARGTTGLIESAQIRHKSGGSSHLTLMSYSQDAEDWQGPRNDLNWYDEEPPIAHYAEGQARLTGRDGMSYMTFTPMAGPTQVVKRFIDEENQYRAHFTMSMDEVRHISDEEKARKWEEYLPHEREARYHGKIMLGEGAVFTVPEADLRVRLDLARISPEWALIWGMDFGGGGATSHPFAAVLLAHDRDADDVYVLKTVKMTGARPLEEAEAMKRIAPLVPVTWPPDGNIAEKTSGKPMASIYKNYGLEMLPEHGTFAEGGYSLYAGLELMNDYMRRRQFFVNETETKWFDEYRMYHLKDGKVVKIDDDLMSATRQGMMMLRKARAVGLGGSRSAWRAQMAELNTPAAIARRAQFDVFEPWGAG